MSIQAGELVVRIVGDGTNLSRDVEQKVNGAAQAAVKSSGRSLQSIGKQARDVGTKMSLAASLPLAALAKSAVDAASATTEATNKVSVVFGKSADEVLRFADTSAKAFGISRREALTAAGTFGNLFRAMGVGQKQAAQVSTAMTGLAGDLASFNDADPSEVLEALRAGLIGEAEPMRRFGVQLSEARVQAEAFALGLVKPTKNSAEITKANLAVGESTEKLAAAQQKYGKGSKEAVGAAADLQLAQDKLAKATKGTMPPLTDAQKLQARQSIIMKDAKLATGDFQRSLSQSAANQARVSKALADDSKAAIGEQLLPLYQRAIIGLGKLAEAFGNLSPEQQKLLLVVAGTVAAMGPLLSIFGNLVRVGSGAGKAFGLVASGASKVVGQARLLGQGFRSAQVAQSAFSGSAGTLGGKLRTATTAMSNGAKAATTWAASTARSAATATRAVVASAAAQARSMATLAAAYARSAAAAAASAARTAVIGTAARAQAAALGVLRVAQIATAAATRVLSLAMAFLAANPIVLVIAALVALGVGLVLLYRKSETFRNIVNAVFGAVARVVSTVVGAVMGFLRKLGGFLVGAASAYVRTYVAVWRFIFNAIRVVVTALWSFVRGAFQRGLAIVRSVVNLVRSVVVAGFRAWTTVVRAVVGAVWSFVSGAFQRGRAIIAAVTGAIRSVIVNGWNRIVAAVTGAVGRMIGVVRGIQGKVMGALRGAASWLIDTGRNIIGGLISGVTGAAGALYDKIAGIASAVKDKFASVLKIFSPSRVFTELGKFIVQGLVKGLTGNAKSAVKASETLAKKVSAAFAKGGLTKRERRRRDRTLAYIRRQRAQQVKLASQNAAITARLTDARKNLQELRDASLEYAAEVSKAILDGGRITEGMGEGVAVTVQTISDRLREQVAQAARFGNSIRALQAKGLAPALIDQIVQAGAANGQATADELANATADQIRQINDLQRQLLTEANSVGQAATKAVNGAGIAAAQSLVSTLEKEQGRIEAVMVRQARAFAAEVRKRMAGLVTTTAKRKSKPSGRRRVGGVVRPFKEYRVGEAGPEILRMGAEGGRVLPRQLTAGAERITVSETHSTTNNINTTVNNPVPEKASTTVPKRLRALAASGALPGSDD